MKKQSIRDRITETAIWAFIKDNRHDEVISSMIKKVEKAYQDDILDKISDYYLKRINLMNPKGYSNNNSGLDEHYWSNVKKYLQKASDAAENISDSDRCASVNSRIIRKALSHLKEIEAPIDELVQFVYRQSQKTETCYLVLSEKESNRFIGLVRIISKAYLDILAVKGKDIFQISQLLLDEEGLVAATRLIPIFIARGDYEALDSIGKKYGRLGNVIASRSEEIILSCLKHGNINGAIGALSWITNDSKRWYYCELLGAELKK